MSITERRKGAKWENDLVKLFRANGWYQAERALGIGNAQICGDILGVTGWTFECKCCTQRYDLAGWLRQVEGCSIDGWRAAVLVKQRGNADPGGGYAIMRIRGFLELLIEAGY